MSKIALLQTVNILATLLVLQLGAVAKGTARKPKSRRAMDFTPYIIGGEETSFADYPFFVHLGYCGGSLVWEDIVLSAAHCDPFEKELAGIVQATVGPNEESVGIESVHVHPFWAEQPTLDYDILVLKLEESGTDLGATIIDLENERDTLEEGEELTVIGLGILDETTGEIPDTLMQVTVNYIPNSVCEETWGIITETQLCAGVDGGGKDACGGDSGGPLFDIEGTQVGVVSFGPSCLPMSDFPGGYARVSEAYDWIKGMICCLSSNPPADCETNECPVSCDPNPCKGDRSYVNQCKWNSDFGDFLCKELRSGPGFGSCFNHESEWYCSGCNKKDDGSRCCNCELAARHCDETDEAYDVCRGRMRSLFMDCNRNGDGYFYCSKARLGEVAPESCYTAEGRFRCESCNGKGNENACCRGCVEVDDNGTIIREVKQH